MRMLNEITIHGSVTSPGWMAGRPVADKVAEIRRWHLDRGFRDIGYHYVIDRDGMIAPGRPIDQVGAGVANANTGKVHICLLGGRGGVGDDVFETHYTVAQDIALRGLIRELQGQHGIRQVKGHNDHAATACPQFTVADWLEETWPNGRPAPAAPASEEDDPFALPRWLRRLIAMITGDRT